jgi:integrase
MVRVEIKGIAKVKSKGRIYYYAWRGGPRLIGRPGTPEFLASYNQAIEDRKATDTDKFRSVVVAYKAGPYTELAPSTRRNWAPWLDEISRYYGDLRTAQFNRPEKIRPIIIRWRNRWADTPRAADYGMQVLSRVLSYAIDPLGKIASNPCEGIKQLYSANRSEIIWTDADIADLKKFCAPEIADAVDLAALTGLRLGDLLRLSWSHIREDWIEISTGKSKHQRTAIIPLYDELRAILARIPRRATTVLTNSKHRPWRANGFGTAFNRAKIAASMNDRNLHFHDLRGTAATKFYLAKVSERQIAEIMGWEEAHVSKIIRRYVDRAAVTKELIRQINAARKEN